MSDWVITTKTGDKGTTSLVNGKRIDKDDPLVELYGTLDECQAHIGMARALCPEPEIAKRLLAIEEQLLSVMGWFAGYEAAGEPDAAILEEIVETVRKMGTGPMKFLKPGDSVPGAAIHIARTVARRAERTATPLFREGRISEKSFAYLNRLSDALFAMNLWLDLALSKRQDT